MLPAMFYNSRGVNIFGKYAIERLYSFFRNIYMQGIFYFFFEKNMAGFCLTRPIIGLML